jgi:hypothetical protein
MTLRILLKFFGVLISASAGIGVTVLIVSPIIWYMNVNANDGPLFSPPLVALGFFGLPYALLFLPVQLLVAFYEFFRGKLSRVVILGIATVNGLLAGILWFFVLRSSSADTVFFLSLTGVAILQSYVVHGLFQLWRRYGPGCLNGAR